MSSKRNDNIQTYLQYVGLLKSMKYAWARKHATILDESNEILEN